MGRDKTGEIRTCLCCHKEVYIPKYRLETFKFCSRKCAYSYKAENETVPITCKTCGELFYVISHRRKLQNIAVNLAIINPLEEKFSET